jgi:hypothetical protein
MRLYFNRSVRIKLRRIYIRTIDDKRAWEIFRHIRWGGRSPRCLYCNGITIIKEKRKNGNQYFYKCKKCKRVFNDITQTPLTKTRLPMRIIIFLIVYMGSENAKNDIKLDLEMTRTTQYRFEKQYKSFKKYFLEIKSQLEEIGINLKNVKNYFFTTCKNSMPLKQRGLIIPDFICDSCNHSFPIYKYRLYHQCPKCGKFIKDFLFQKYCY